MGVHQRGPHFSAMHERRKSRKNSEARGRFWCGTVLVRGKSEPTNILPNGGCFMVMNPLAMVEFVKT